MGTSSRPLPISHLESLSADEIRELVDRGYRFVRFVRCTSFLIATFRHESRIYLTENWQGRYLRGLGYSMLSLLLGPWGVPWGLFLTAQSLWTNLTGGIDVTDDVLAAIGRPL